MREIKFRAKRIDNGQWVYGYYFVTPITEENSGLPPKKGWFFLSDGKIRHCIIESSVAFVIDKTTLGEYTGIKDKNGKEIYEGDIIYRKKPGMFKGEPDREEKEVVTWNENKCGFCGDESSTSIWFYVMENPIQYYVIGNIYENPELLHEVKK